MKMLSFLYPRGNIHKKYTQYVGWSFVSNFMVSVESVLSTHSMLSVVGHASTDIIISANYIGKDIIGQIGGLWYINKIGNKVDKDPKKFAKYSLAFQQFSVFAECATPLLAPDAFVAIAGCANMGKNISATGLGAINAKIIPILAQDNNMGEMYAKLSMLNTLGSSIGMISGLCVAALVPDHSTRLCIMPIFTALRLYSYNKSIDGLLDTN